MLFFMANIFKNQTGHERTCNHAKETANERYQHYLPTPVSVTQITKNCGANNPPNHLDGDGEFDEIRLT